ncbi:MAG: type VI secretion system membrane subunit TssM [Chromatiaceae bacterium]|nr:type VI secretion system membrane subunit TssM [Chromatiaceae bacterium]
MQAILRIVKNRWFIVALGLIAIAMIIWLVGPLIAIAGHEPLEPENNRLIAIAVVVLLWGLNQLRRYLAARKKNRQMLDSVVAQPEGDAYARHESAEELEVLRQRLNEAIGILKESRLGGKQNRQYLYQLPWYMFIGPPGSGKTTALLNSGLHFPLADKLGKDAVQGIGGTRNCDWWFTDDAVLLDTAGRYTTQDSYEEVDRAAWTGFLDLLKKHRRRRPINGALVAISVEDLLRQTELERQSHAKAIHKRIQELHDRFGIRFPVYVLFTKSDLLAGFSEFFENLGREERGQVWGMTFPVTAKDDPEGGIARFAEEFKALEKRIDELLLERMDQERDPRRRVLLYSFPQQFNSLRDTAERFLNEAFGPSRFEEPPMVRGVYFTSGTQEGTPIDRLLGSMAKGFGLNRQIAPAFSGSGRSFFLQRLLTGVIFREAHLAGINTRLERQRAWLQNTAYIAAIGLAVAAGVAWFTSYSRNQSYVELVAEKAAAAEQQVMAVAPGDLSLTGVVNALDAVQKIPGGYADREEDIPLLMGLGLYQGDKLGEEAGAAYANALKNLFLPRLILSLEEQLRQPGNNPDFAYEALKVYLMLDDREHFDAEAVKAWMVLHWQLTLSGASNAQLRETLTGHLDALLAQMPMAPTLSLDQGLISNVRDTLLRVPLATRAYNRMKRTSGGASVPPFRLSSALGSDAARVFDRRSGQPLDNEIPALFTYDGYHKLFQKAHLEIGRALLEEKWVLGPGFEQRNDEIDLAALSAQVKRLYYDEYISVWDGLLSDLRIIPFSNLNQAVEALNILSGPNSMLRRLLRAIEQETALMRLPEGAAKAAEAAEKRFSGITGKLASILQVSPGAGNSAGNEPLLTTPVDQHFAELHKMIRAEESEPPPIERTLAMLEELYVHMSAISSAANQSTQAYNAAKIQTTGGENVVDRIKLEAKRQPGAVAELLTSVAEGSSNLTASGVRAHLNAIWRTQVLPFYQRSLAGRYPLRPNGTKEATVSDFGRFFGVGGIMDEFFTSYLRDFVDTTGRVWRWTAPGSRKLGIPSSTLRLFQHAATIRDTFFSAGGQQPKINFDMKPLGMDTSISQLTLLLNKQKINYSHGPTRWSRLTWPDDDAGVSDAKILFSPPTGSNPSGISRDGSWGWFRLIDQAKRSQTDAPETIKVVFTIGGRSAQFLIRASGALNPFQLKELEGFWCPNSL